MANTQNLQPFKKGYDPRRGTKPKGSKHISTYIKELLEEEGALYQLPDGTRYSGPPVNAIIKAAIIKATSGDMRAADFIIKYGYGPPTEDFEPQKILIETRKHSCVCKEQNDAGKSAGQS